MRLDPATVQSLAVSVRPRRWVRVMRREFEQTPLGTGPGDSRFCFPGCGYAVLYMACDLATAVAETVVRDRFEAARERVLDLSECDDWAAAELSATRPLTLVDLTAGGAFRLGVSTDAIGAKAHREGQRLGKALHDGFAVDGVLYNSRLTSRPCIALYDRAVGRLMSARSAPLSRLADLKGALAELNIRLRRDP